MIFSKKFLIVITLGFVSILLFSLFVLSTKEKTKMGLTLRERDISGFLSLVDFEFNGSRYVVKTTDLNPQISSNKTIDVDLNPILVELGVRSSDSKYVKINKNKIENCETKKFNLNIDEEYLKETIIEALDKRDLAIIEKHKLIIEIEDLNLFDLCNELNIKRDLINSALKNSLGEKESFEKYFDYNLIDRKSLRFFLSDESALRKTLEEFSKATYIEPIEGKYEVQGDKLFLLSQFTEGRELNLEKTIVEINDWIFSPKFNLPIEFVKIDAPILKTGKYIYDFTQKIGSGTTRIDLVRNGVSNYVIQFAEAGLYELQNVIIQPKEEFSYLNLIQPTPNGTTKNGRPISGGICNSTTTLFRAALEAGFPITERFYHYANVPSYSWPYPLNIVDAAYLTEPKVDLKFINDTEYPILLKLEFTKDNEWQYHTVNILSNSNAKKRKVELYNWRKWNQNGVSFEGSFNRRVSESEKIIREDSFYSRYF